MFVDSFKMDFTESLLVVGPNFDGWILVEDFLVFFFGERVDGVEFIFFARSAFGRIVVNLLV